LVLYFMKNLLTLSYLNHIKKILSWYRINLTKINRFTTILKWALCDEFIQSNKFVRIWQWKYMLILFSLLFILDLFRWILTWYLWLIIKKCLLSILYLSLPIMHCDVKFYHSSWKEINVRKHQSRFLYFSII